MSFQNKDEVTFNDAIGIPLFVGAKVAWGVGGRGNFGLAVGEVTALNVVESRPRRFDYTARQYIEGDLQYHGEIVVKSLWSGRKGRTYRADRDEVVLISDQTYTGIAA